MGRISHFVRRVYYTLQYRKKNVKLYKGSNIRSETEFEGNNVIGYYSDYKGKIGYGSYIGENCYISADIGRFCCIGNSVITINGFHPSDTYVSIHPAFFSTRHKDLESYVDADSFEEHKYVNKKRGISVKIGNDVWIGTRVSIIAGVTIGDGAIIATGAVVVKDIEPYAIYGGVPAKKIGQRFSNDQIDKLCTFQWWNRSIDWIKWAAGYYRDINGFVEQVIRTDDKE